MASVFNIQKNPDQTGYQDDRLCLGSSPYNLKKLHPNISSDGSMLKVLRSPNSKLGYDYTIERIECKIGRYHVPVLDINAIIGKTEEQACKLIYDAIYHVFEKNNFNISFIEDSGR
jgi:hypothetical protein